MGPIRGLNKRKKIEKEVGDDTWVSSPPPTLPLDWWQHFSKRIDGPLSKLNFETIFKMSRKTFDYICSLVGKRMMAGNLKYINGQILCRNDQVAVALRRLTSGDTEKVVGKSFGLQKSYVGKITWRFVEAIEETRLHHLQWPSTEAQMEEIKTKFEKIKGLPNCCGAIDTTHIMMHLPRVEKSRDIWLDREKNHAMVLQAIVDPDLRFQDVFAGLPGSLTDTDILESSSFFKLCHC